MEKLCYFDDASHNHETSTAFRSNSQKKKYLSLSGLIFVISLLIPGFSAYAQCITQDFSSVITGPVSAPETWFPDRFAVAFTAGETSPDGRTNTLKHAIASADKQVVGGVDEQSGNNTQGRQYQLPNGTKVIQADLFIANGWSTSFRRMAGLWAVALNNGSAVSAYPIIEYISNGTEGKFRGYEGVTSNAWHDITLPGSIPDNSWVTLKIELLPNGEFRYTVNELSYTTTVFTTEGSESLGTAIFQGHNSNAGVTYDIFWDNFKAGPTSGLVQNTNTGKLFCTIQSAIDDASTLAGHTIRVSAGVYSGNVVVSKAINLQGAKSGVDPRPYASSTRTPGGADESIIEGVKSSIVLHIISGNVTVDGFSIRHNGGSGNSDLVTSPAIPTQTNLSFVNNILTDATDEGIQIRGFSDATIQKNYILNSIGDGVNFADNIGSTNLNILDNEIENSGSEHGAIFLYLVNDVKIERNIIKTPLRGGIRLGRSSSDSHVTNILVKNNEISGAFASGSGSEWGIGVHGAASGVIFTEGIVIENNRIIQSGGTVAGNFVHFNSYGNVKNLSFKNNYLETTGTKYMRFGNTSNNLSPAQQIDATCNWFGSAVIGDVLGKVTNQGIHKVVPFLSTGDDSNGATIGFIPSGPCLGPVRNVEQGTYFATIQAAIDDPATVATNHIEVSAGTYDETVTVNKSLFILGANAGTAGNSLARVSESILDGNNGTHSGFIVTANDVTINGFKVQNCALGIGESGIYTTASGTQIINNILFNNAKGVYASNTGPANIQNNLFDGNNRPGPAGAVAIYGFTSNALSVTNNEFKNQTANSVALFDGGAGHQNLVFNNNYLHDNFSGASAVYAAKISTGEFAGNAISNGNRGIKIAGGNTSISIQNNQISGTVEADILLDTDFGTNSDIQIHNNSLTGTLAIKNNENVNVDAACNWYGSIIPATVASKISGLVNYQPFTNSGTDASADPGFQPGANTCIYLVHNLDTSEDFGTIQQAIDDANTVNGNTIKVDAGSFTGSLIISKSLNFQGSNSGTCGTETRESETILIAPATAEPGMIQLSGPVNVSFDGFKFDGTGIAYITGVDQELSIKNSVLELDFLTDKNNLYFSSRKLTLECNYFQAIAGTNNLGNASHLLYGGQAMEVKNNKFTSLAARSSISATSTSLPVWINLTTNANNVSIIENDFNRIDMGVLIASNAGNVRIENNEFYDALRQNIPFGSGMGAGIGLFQDLAPAAPILITKNKFIAGETGIRTSGNGTSFPAPGLLAISYNSFESQIDKAISLESTYSGSTNKLNALCNWFGAINGPIISTNAGAGGTQILDAGGKVSFRNWLVYGDATPGQIGFQTPSAFTVSSPGTPTVAGNDYRILSNAVGCALENQEITLSGSFDYTHATTLAEWAKGNDGDASSTGDNYSILAPVNLNGVKLIGASSATITGPGDLPNTNLEKFLAFNNGYNRNWDISGLTIKDFDVSIGLFSTANYPTNNSGLKIHNNTFYIPKDLNATVAPVDVNQNIGINLANGANQIIENNTVYIDGTGESNGTTALSTSIFLQSTTTGGNGYDGLRIRNNIVQVKGEPQAEPNQAVIRGIWENSQSTASDIEISGNVFNNEPGLNTANLNRQFAFWITSRSGAGKPVVYKNNEVTGYEEGIGWLGGLFTANTAPNYEATATPVTIENNKFTNVRNGVVVRKAVSSPNTGSPAIISNNSFTGIATGGFAIVNQSTGETNAECNWYDTPIAANAISSTGGGTVKFNPKLSTGTDNDVAIGFQPVPNSCILPVLNYTTSTYYPTIQSAIDAAETLAGNEIRVSAGIYPENVLVNKGVLIVGADSANVIIDKGAANFGAAGGAGFRLAADGITLSKMKVQNFNNGIETETATTGVTIDEMNLNMNYSNGFFGKRSATDLTIRNSNLNANGVTPGGAQTGSYMRGFMFEAQANAVITKLVITNSNFKSNGLVGIDISSLIPVNGIDINANRVWDNFDSQIGVSLGNNSLTGEPVSISTNNLRVSGSARFGIEVKNPLGNGTASGSGSIVVASNTIAVVNQTPGGTARDLAAIAVMRRKGGYASINNQPQGVRVIGNIISDFQNPGAGDAFGIVLGGTGHYVANNTITNTNYSIQLQKGNEKFNSDNDSGNNTNEYFERDNSGDVCVEIGANSIDGISGVPRIVTGASATSTTLPVTRVSNLTLAGSSKFCTIQQAINFTATTTGHVLDALAGDYPENVVVNKSVTLQGPNNAVSGSGLRAAEAVIIPGLDDVSGGTLVRIEANNVNIKGLAIDGSNTAFAPNIIINGAQTHAAYGITAFGEITGLNVSNNIIKNISKHGIDLNANNGSTQNNEINGNLFDNIPRFSASGSGFYGRGILLANNFYASVKNNKFTRVERGIQTNNFSKAILGGQWEISGNDIRAYNIGSFINLHYQATSDLLFENNIIEKDATTRTISTTDALPDEDFTGVEVFSISNTASVTLKGGTITNAAQGVYSWNNSSSNHVTVDGVAFSNNAIAVLLSNFSRYSGAVDSEIDVKNVTITAGNAVKAFVAEDHSSGSGAISAINMVTGNVLTSSGTFTHPFHLQGGLKARIKAGGTAVTSSSVDAFTFDIPAGTSSIANVIIQAGLSVTLGGTSHRVINLPAGLVMQMDGDFTPPNKITDNPVLINGALWFNSGILNSGDGSIEFGNTAADIMTGPHAEKVASYILGKALMASRAVGGDAIDMLGVKMMAGPSVGNLVITRTTKTSGSIMPAFPGDGSIRTVWDITPSITSASRGDVQFRYLDLASNINAQTPGAIYAYRYNTATSQWDKKSALRNSNLELGTNIYTTEAFGVAEFSAWTLSSAEPGPDLRPLIVMSDVGFIKPSALSKNAVLRLYNVGGVGTTATGLITVYVYPPSDKFTITLGASPDWNLAYDSGGNYYTLTSNSTSINYGAPEFKTVNLIVTALNTVSKGKYGIQFEIGEGSGGETNNFNNTTGVEIVVSGL